MASMNPSQTEVDNHRGQPTPARLLNTAGTTVATSGRKGVLSHWYPGPLNGGFHATVKDLR